MPDRISFSVPQSAPLKRPNLPLVTTPKPLTSDENQVSNTPQAAGTDLITRSVNDIGQINGIGGNVDFSA